ncbi:MAG: glutathione peroxidase [Alphaproteobacteria bacterium]|nr:glutathione peroxidase [Alphaproteobacteria bacterium]MBV9694933.1 glutathione peroxidase [Alphaproteobacteria bacterium]
MTTAYDFQFRSIDGAPLPLSSFKGKALLVVNVASQCGLTPQYEGLEKLWREKRDAGLVVLGVPANDFGAQEPGSENEIKTFCETRFSVDFPMTAKEHVIGAEAHPLYRWVAKELGEAAAPKWNFHKYLFGRDGSIAGTFGSRTEPGAADLREAIEGALK